jgi:hypothetical protein
MEAITWIDRITDETNPWLTATKKEEEDDLPQAAQLYLKDAGECLKQDSLVKAALSCSCAADCLSRVGQLDKAQLLYSEAAHLYLENADFVIGKSVRESLWSLREAHEYFLLAGDKLASRQVSDRLVHLASRVDPNVGNEEITRVPQSRTPVIGGKSIKETFPLSNSTDMVASLEQFLRLRRSRDGLEIKSAPSTAVTAARRRGPINEESIISQLG